MSFLTPETLKDAFKYPKTGSKTLIVTNNANEALNDRLGTYLNNISHKHSLHIILWAWITF